jgi:hypothetical protein
MSILLVVILAILSNNNALTPGILMIFCFVLFVLYMTGLVDTGIQLFGTGNVNSNCNNFVAHDQSHGVSVSTLAWLEQNSICKCSDLVCCTPKACLTFKKVVVGTQFSHSGWWELLYT